MRQRVWHSEGYAIFLGPTKARCRCFCIRSCLRGRLDAFEGRGSGGPDLRDWFDLRQLYPGWLDRGFTVWVYGGRASGV